MNKDVVNELNNFLKGQYIGIHQYERLIQHTKDPYIRSELQKIQQDHKLHAIMVAERIQNLGGTAVDGAGLKGTIADTMSRLKGTDNDINEIINQAVKGESMGINASVELVKGDLDFESKKIVEDILNTDKGHIEHLNNLLH
ncbi:MAG: ferritin-like domain-containing protein [Bacillota bacterium]